MAKTGGAAGKGHFVRGSGVASAAARRVAGGPARGGWRAKLAAAANMRPSEITGTDRRAVRMRRPVPRKKSSAGTGGERRAVHMRRMVARDITRNTESAWSERAGSPDVITRTQLGLDSYLLRSIDVFGPCTLYGQPGGHIQADPNDAKLWRAKEGEGE